MSIHCKSAERDEERDDKPIICKKDNLPCGYQFYCWITKQMEQKSDANYCTRERGEKSV